MSLYEIPLTAADGAPLDAAQLRGRLTLVVNVASRCGLTPQYEALERLHRTYRERGFGVLGVPCNQFGGQEPWSEEEILEFCSSEYDVTFPLTEKVDVNGRQSHPLYERLRGTPDDRGVAGDVQWNFEKFLVSPRGEVVGRYRPNTVPDSDEVVAAIEANLPGGEPEWQTKPAAEVCEGDRVRMASGAELTVTRIEREFLDRENLLCLIEDTPERWYAQPVRDAVEVQVLVSR